MDTRFLKLEGQIYNARELAAELKMPEPATHEEVEELIFQGYKLWGAQVVKHLDGEFVISIYDSKEDSVYLFRDPLGVCTVYYTLVQGQLLYSSDLSKILKYPGLKPVLDREGACELLGLGPARTPGKTPVKNVREVKPGHYLRFHRGVAKEYPYWELMTKQEVLSEEETVQKGRELLNKAMKKRLPDAEVAVLLSGGLDSSYLAALCKKSGSRMKTFSLDFVGSQQFFVPNSFQPELDRPFVERMVHSLGTSHKTILCDVKTQAAGLLNAMRSHGLPCMADIQTTLDFLCREVAKESRYLLTGECADEIFGGYPWFHVPEYVNYEGFPWMYDLAPRISILCKDVQEKLKLSDYVKQTYEDSCKKVRYPENEEALERVLRKNTYLTVYYFMQTLIRRTAVAAQQTGLTAIVPFVDPQLVEFAYNIPWSMKKKQGIRKYVLRKMAMGELPEEVRNRPKSPYPKNYNPEYIAVLKKIWEQEEKGECPVYELVDKASLYQLFTEDGMKTPWFGQLMKGPQRLAYMYMMNAWLKEYNIDIDLS